MGMPINHAHPDTWPPVQPEMIVLVFLGFTVQHAFVRRRFVPILMEAHALLRGTWDMCSTEL